MMLVFWLELLKSIYQFWKYVHFDCIGFTYSGAWTNFLFPDILFDLIFQSDTVFIIEVFHFFG